MKVMLPALQTIEAAAEVVYRVLSPTPQIAWPLLAVRLGCEVWVKHENHTPIGAFKVRGGLTYFEHLRREGLPAGVISATRGNHGQSIGFAARRHGIPATIVVPHGNSREKNAAMCALGVELIEHGEDFQAAREHAIALAELRGLLMVPSFHPWLIDGVATYALEFLRGVPSLDVVYVPIGLGSGICGMIAVRDALNSTSEIVGVVAAGAPAYALSMAAGACVAHPVTTTLGDGMACRVPDPAALEILRRGVTRLVTVTDDELAAAMCILFEDTHNTAEGAGAAALAGALQERSRLAGKRVGIVLSGGNVDRDVFARVLST